MTSTPAARAARSAGSAPAALRWTTWARPPVVRAPSTTRSIGALLGRGRSRLEEAGVRRPVGAARAIASPSSACTIISAPSRAVSAIAAAKPGRCEVRELLDPRVEQEALEAEDPGLVERPRGRPRCPAPRRPRSRRRRTPGRGRPPASRSSAATVVVGGMLLSGMSTIVVTPPAAAARVALAKPSHSVRPGSLTWTWVSTSPGSSTSSSASSTTSPGVRAGASYAVTADDPAVPDADGGRRSRAVDDRARGRGRRVEPAEGPQLPR